MSVTDSKLPSLKDKLEAPPVPEVVETPEETEEPAEKKGRKINKKKK